jgi:hypothetical protein
VGKQRILRQPGAIVIFHCCCCQMQKYHTVQVAMQCSGPAIQLMAQLSFWTGPTVGPAVQHGVNAGCSLLLVSALRGGSVLLLRLAANLAHQSAPVDADKGLTPAEHRHTQGSHGSRRPHPANTCNNGQHQPLAQQCCAVCIQPSLSRVLPQTVQHSINCFPGRQTPDAKDAWGYSDDAGGVICPVAHVMKIWESTVKVEIQLMEYHVE